MAAQNALNNPLNAAAQLQPLAAVALQAAQVQQHLVGNQANVALQQQQQPIFDYATLAAAAAAAQNNVAYSMHPSGLFFNTKKI